MIKPGCPRPTVGEISNERWEYEPPEANKPQRTDGRYQTRTHESCYDSNPERQHDPAERKPNIQPDHESTGGEYQKTDHSQSEKTSAWRFTDYVRRDAYLFERGHKCQLCLHTQ